MRVYELVLNNKKIELNYTFPKSKFLEKKDGLYFILENSDEMIKINKDALNKNILDEYILSVEPCIGRVQNDVKVFNYLDKEITEEGIFLIVNIPSNYLVSIKEANTLAKNEVEKSKLDITDKNISVYVSKNDLKITILKNQRLVLQTICNR